MTTMMMSGPLCRLYKLDDVNDSPRTLANKDKRWWAILRPNGVLHVRQYLGPIDIQSARQSGDCKNRVTEPFKATDAAAARRIAEGILHA